MDRIDWMMELGEHTRPELPTMPVGRNGPDLWDTLLELVGVTGAVVAGGCVRDYLLRLDPKDIDIFVPLAEREELEALAERLNDTGSFSLVIINPESGSSEYEEIEGGYLVGVLEGEALGLPVNIIARVAHQDGDFDLINDFDFGIVQWAYTGEYLVGTPLAATDLATRTATLATNRYYEQSIERFKRFAARNPGALGIADPYGSF